MLKKLVPDPPHRLFLIPEHVNQEEALNHASDLLQCILVTASQGYDADASALRGLNSSVAHLAQLAKALVDRSIDDFSVDR